MKKHVLIVFLLVVLFAISVCSLVECQAADREAKLIAFQGDVSVLKAGVDSWTAAQKDMLLQEGDKVKTGKRSTARFNVDASGDVATVDVRPDTVMSLKSLIADAQTSAKQTMLDLSMGNILIKVKKLDLEQNARFEVETPTAVLGVRGTEFEVEVTEKSN